MSNGLLVAQLKYAVDNNAILTPTHKKVGVSMYNYYKKAGTLTQAQIGYLKSILKGCALPADLEPLSFRDAVKTDPKTAQNQNNPETPPEIKRVELVGKVIHIHFPYDTGTVALVKSLHKRKYNKSEKLWTAPLSIYNMNALRKWGFRLSPELRKWMRVNGTIPIHDSFKVPGLKTDLLPFQVEGLSFIEQNCGNVLLGDDMGLGKTIQALAYLQLHPEIRPALIITPATLKWNWHKEIRKFMSTDDTVQVIEGGYTPNETLYGDIVIVNYDILPDATEKKVVRGKNGEKKTVRETIPNTGWWNRLHAHSFKIAIMDEVHKIKNYKASRSEVTMKTVAKIESVIALSGTPMLSRPQELYNPIHVVNPYLFSTFINFGVAYCGAFKSKWGWDFSGSTNQSELHQLLTNTIMLRRLKKDVLKDLPPKTRSVIPLELTNRREYKKAASDLLYYLKGIDPAKADKAARAEHLVRIETLKDIAAKGKAKACIKWIKDFLESGEKLVVFTRHQFLMDTIMETFSKIAVKVDGSVSPKKRIQAQDQFQDNDKIKLFVGNLEAASEGLTLTASSNTCFLELGWTPGAMIQAEDRVHRIGQTLPVTSWYLLARDSIEVEIMQLLEKKAILLDQILDGVDIPDEVEDASSIFNDLLSALAA